MQLFQRREELAEEEELSQYLTFQLDKQEFGVELARIQEIRGYTPITPIPNAPPYIKGVINLRGVVLPVVDLRMKFSKPSLEYTKFTVILIAKVGPSGLGLIVDAVSDVLSVSPDSVAPAPEFGYALDNKVVKGIIKADNRLAVLINLDQIATADEIASPVAVAVEDDVESIEEGELVADS